MSGLENGPSISNTNSIQDLAQDSLCRGAFGVRKKSVKERCGNKARKSKFRLRILYKKMYPPCCKEVDDGVLALRQGFDDPHDFLQRQCVQHAFAFDSNRHQPTDSFHLRLR